MSAVGAAVAIVLVSNLVFLVMAGFVLSRLMRQAERLGGAEPTSRHPDDRRAVEIERLHAQARDLVQRLAVLLKLAAAPTTPAGARPSTADRSADAGPSFELGATRDTSDRAGEAALARQVEALRGELADAWAALSQSGEDADDADDERAVLVARFEARLRTLRELLEGVEGGSHPRTAAASPAGQDSDDEALDSRLGAVRGRLASVEQDNQLLRREVDELKDLVERTRREKDFIEGRFMVLDRTLVEAGTDVPLDAAALPH